MAGSLMLALTPVEAWTAAASLGTARGVRQAELSLDDGQSWLSLGGRSLPVMEGAGIRTANGVALVELGDGSLINVLPFTSVRFSSTKAVTEVVFRCGRVTFRLPEQARTSIVTPSSRVEGLREGVAVGEVFADRADVTGVKVFQGAATVRELVGSRREIRARVEPVFVPRPPVGWGPLFVSEARPAPPGARAVFSQQGESFGYLRPDGEIVTEPGFTANLTQPFPPRLVRSALANVPVKHRERAITLLDVNGGYAGYVRGPSGCAQIVAASPTTSVETLPPVMGETALATTALTTMGGGVIWFFVTTVAEDTEPVASPLRP